MLIQACVIPSVQPNHHTVTRLHLVILSIQTRDFSVSVFGIGISLSFMHSEISHSIRKLNWTFYRMRNREKPVWICVFSEVVRKLSDSLGSLCWASSSTEFSLSLHGLQTLPKTSLYCLHSKYPYHTTYFLPISLTFLCHALKFLPHIHVLSFLGTEILKNSKVRACCKRVLIHMD